MSIHISIHNKFFVYLLSKFNIANEIPENNSNRESVILALKRAKLIDKHKYYNPETIDYLFVLERLYLSKIALNTYYPVIRCWRLLRNFVSRIKTKKLRIHEVDTDLSLRPLIEYPITEIINIIETEYAYRFTISDLLKIVNNSLQHHDYLFPTPQFPKNPYTNLPFSRSNLYNIYIACKNTGKIISPLFHQFMLCDFDIHRFSMCNDNQLREVAISQYFIENKNNTDSFHIDDIYAIIEWYCRTMNYSIDRYQIHPECPKKEIIEIFRPYLKLYYQYTYLNSITSKERLLDSLIQFFIYNPKFGKAYMIPCPRQEFTEYEYDLRHMPISIMDHNYRMMPLYRQILEQTYEFADDFLTLPPIKNAIYLSNYTTFHSTLLSDTINIQPISIEYSSESESESESDDDDDDDVE
jgi:hypothetical protein